MRPKHNPNAQTVQEVAYDVKKSAGEHVDRTLIIRTITHAQHLTDSGTTPGKPLAMPPSTL